MRRIDFFIEEHQVNLKVETYLRQVQGMSLRVIKRLKHDPLGLLLNGRHIRTVDFIKPGDTLSVTIPDDEQDYLENDTHVDILYEDDDVMVYNKPYGMPCHQAKNNQQNTLANVFARHGRENGVSLSFRSINRLDRNTTGAVVVAKNAHAATKLGGVEKGNGTVEKVYTAILVGILPYEKGIIDANIDRMSDEYINRIVSSTGQFARTEFTVTGYGERYTMANFHLHTGRTHQIRVHMSWLGYPVAGDDLYGWDSEIISRQALHCAEVSFVQPVSGERITVKAPFFDDMSEAVKKAGILPAQCTAKFKKG